jgi:hypothetical protein
MSAAGNPLRVLAAPNQQVAAAAVSPGYSAGAASAQTAAVLPKKNAAVFFF